MHGNDRLLVVVGSGSGYTGGIGAHATSSTTMSTAARNSDGQVIIFMVMQK